jgi:hypothetical protein
MPTEAREQSEFTDAELKDALKRVGEDARRAAFQSGHPVAFLKDGKLVQVFPDGREIAVPSAEPEAHDEVIAR